METLKGSYGKELALKYTSQCSPEKCNKLDGWMNGWTDGWMDEAYID